MRWLVAGAQCQLPGMRPTWAVTVRACEFPYVFLYLDTLTALHPRSLAVPTVARLPVRMKSWSQGRKSGRKDKQAAATTPSPRPQSMILAFPSTSSSAQLSSADPPSPLLTNSASPRAPSLGDGAGFSSALSYLSSAQEKDKGQREKASSKEASRVRTSSLPSLIKAPSVAAPAPTTALLSPTAAIIRRSSPDTATHPASAHEGTKVASGSASMRSFESLVHPSTPSPQPGRSKARQHLTTEAKEPDRTSELQPLPATPIGPKQRSGTKKADEEVNGALASLRRFKGVEGYGSLDRKHLEAVDSMSVKESSSLEDVKQEGEAVEMRDDDGETEYAFAVRKRRGGRKAGAKLSKQRARAVEARYNLAIVTQHVHSLAFLERQGRPSRLIIAMPLPSFLGCNQVAAWAVERCARLTSCVIHALGS